MKKALLIMVGAAGLLAADLAAAQTPAAPPAPPAAPAGPDGAGPGVHRFRGPGPGRMMMRRMHRQRPSLEEVQKRNAEAFARMDANKDGRVVFDEFRQDIERRRAERQQRMFQRFSGGQDSVTLDQLNARTAERYNQRGRRQGGQGGPAQGGQAPNARPAQ